jgi:hypothetical protein
MANENGVLVTLRGRGRENQWMLDYSEPNTEFQGEFWAYRRDDLERDAPIQDFWTVSLGARFWPFLQKEHSKLLAQIADDIGECLLRWPVDRGLNAFPAKSVRILEPKGRAFLKVVTLASTEGPTNG